jgi:hypothetical protein
VTDLINRAGSRLLLRNVVVPDAVRRFRKALAEEGAGDIAGLTQRVSREALKAHADEFPEIGREHGARLVDLYAELCQEAFAEEYVRFIQPKPDAEDSIH